MITRLLRTMLAVCLVSAAATADPKPPDTAAYDELLRKFVAADGDVDYAGLNREFEKLDGFVSQIAAVSPHSHPNLFPTRESRLAYWINTYNALVLWAFAKDYPKDKERLKGLIGRGLFFYRRKFPVGGRKRSLASIENDTIRDEFSEPRIHFALVCASASCPWLAPKAYTVQNIEAMLEQQTRQFINQERNITLDLSSKEVRLSKIFDWYKEDFGEGGPELLSFIARYREQDGSRLRGGNWKIRYFDYDWSLNELR